MCVYLFVHVFPPKAPDRFRGRLGRTAEERAQPTLPEPLGCVAVVEKLEQKQTIVLLRRKRLGAA